MFISKISLKDGSHYYSFSYDKEGKRIRLKRSSHPHFTDRKSAEAWVKSRNGYEASSSALIAKKIAWKTQFYDFEPLVKQYSDWQQLHAPNSYKNNIIYFEQYVLAWFLGIKKQNNVNGWHFIYTEFTTYLRTTCTTARSKRIITIATANKIIHTLNSFVRFLSLHNLIDPSASMKCPSFPEHMQNQKSIDDIIPEDEFAAIYKRLVLINSESADFFLLLYRTGMRLNEGLSMPISALFKYSYDCTCSNSYC